MVATHALAVEPRRRAPDPRADEGRGEVVVDPVGHVRDGRAGSSASGSGSVFPSVRRWTRISPVRRQTASRNASRLASSITDTGTTSRSGNAAAQPLDGLRRAPRRRGSPRGRPASRCPASVDLGANGPKLVGIGVGAGAVDDRVGRAEHAEQRPAAAAVLGRALDQPGDLDELDEDAADPGERRDRAERRERVVAGLDLDLATAPGGCDDLPTFGGPTSAIWAAPSRRTAIESRWTAFDRTRVSSISEVSHLRRSAYGPFL